MDHNTAPAVLVVDGADLATTGPGKASPARLESAIAAMRTAMPSTRCVVLVEASLQEHLSPPPGPEVVHQVVLIGVEDSGRVILRTAESMQAAVVSNASFYRERDDFAWVTQPDRLLGHTYVGDGWWVFMTRTGGAHVSWTGHDGGPPAAESAHRETSSAGDAGSLPPTYAALIDSTAATVAIVPHEVVQAAVAILYDAEGPRAREEIVAKIVTRELGLTMYGAAALLYRFEQSGIVSETKAGWLERTPDLNAATAMAAVERDILAEVLALGESALGYRDEPAARAALGLPTDPAAPEADVDEPSGASPAVRDEEVPEPAQPAKAKAGTPESTRAKAAIPPGKAKPAKTRGAKPEPAKAKARVTRAKPAEAGAGKPGRAKAIPATSPSTKPASKRSASDKAAVKGPEASTAPVRAARPKVRTGADGIAEWVVRCPTCGMEIVGADRATVASELAAHRCEG